VDGRGIADYDAGSPLFPKKVYHRFNKERMGGDGSFGEIVSENIGFNQNCLPGKGGPPGSRVYLTKVPENFIQVIPGTSPQRYNWVHRERNDEGYGG